MTAALLERWRAALPPGARSDLVEESGADLLRRWSEPQRRYHTLDHLTFMLSIVDRHAASADDADAVRLAAWFHDAVYDPTASDNEMRSAALAAAVLPALTVTPERTAEVVRLVWLTATHAVDDADTNGALLCDADLAILAVAPESYDNYRRAIRDEYAHVPDDAFRVGRSAVLRQLLGLEKLFHLPALRDEWDAQARANLLDECDALSAN